MALSQQKFREIVLQLLYSQDVARPDESQLIELMMHELAVSKKNVRLAMERVKKIQENLSKIDEHLESVATSYHFDRIQVVTRNILRVGVFELLYDELIPPKVAISEAIRLSRKFNTPESASFVNALLDALHQKNQGQDVDPEEIARKGAELAKSEEIPSEVIAQSTLLKENEEMERTSIDEIDR